MITECRYFHYFTKYTVAVPAFYSRAGQWGGQHILEKAKCQDFNNSRKCYLVGGGEVFVVNLYNKAFKTNRF